MSAVEAGLVVVGPETAPACPMCASRAPSQPLMTDDRRDELVPWAIVRTSAVVLASVGVGGARWFGLGAAAGLLAGAACAWLTVRVLTARRAAAQAAEVAALAGESDARVETVIRQFEWAVNDVVKLKRDLERAEAAADALVERARQRERFVEKLERDLFAAREHLATKLVREDDAEILSAAELAPAPDVVPFRWGLHHDGHRSNFELECGVTAHRPRRVRIVDGDGTIALVSGTPMHNEDGTIGFTLAQPPAALIADLDAGRDTPYHLEALVDREWKRVSLEDTGRRTKLIYDKQGRLYRVSDDRDAAQLLAPTLG